MNYTYAQMKEMQEQAFERVREMQKRADFTAKQAMRDMGAVPEKTNEEKPRDSSVPSDPVRRPAKVPDEPKRYSMPVEFPDRTQDVRASDTENRTGFLNKLFDFNSDEKETALLLTLIMILYEENPDKELLFALMYILN